MEFSERKRSRKSQSFKLVSRDHHHEVYKIIEFSHDANGEATDTQPIVLGDESVEIKKQITGMRRLLNDSTGRIYQRVGKEGEKLKEEPQDLDLIWPQRLNSSTEAPQSLHPLSRGSWNEPSSQSGQFSGQYGTRSRTFQSQPHTTASSNGELPSMNPSVGSNCCTCSCQSTLQAILQELRTMRKLMQFQAVGSQNRQQPPISLICSQRSAVSRKRNKKKKMLPKTVEPITMKPKPSVLEVEKSAARAMGQSGLQAIENTSTEESHVLGFGIVLQSPSSDGTKEPLPVSYEEIICLFESGDSNSIVNDRQVKRRDTRLWAKRRKITVVFQGTCTSSYGQKRWASSPLQACHLPLSTVGKTLGAHSSTLLGHDEHSVTLYG